MPGALGLVFPPDKEHIVTKPLTALAGAGPVDVPLVVGVNWYDSFDAPRELKSTAEGTSWHLPDVAKGESLGSVRGGHCFAFEPMGQVKLNQGRLRVFYDQGPEGACVGFGLSRAQAMMRGHQTFDAFWLYDQARKSEGTYPDGEGSTVRAGAKVLETVGQRVQTGQIVCTREKGDGPVDPKLGVVATRWITTVDEALTALARPSAQAIPFQNNWGNSYPDVVWCPVATFDRLLKEEGECAIFTDR